MLHVTNNPAIPDGGIESLETFVYNRTAYEMEPEIRLTDEQRNSLRDTVNAYKYIAGRSQDMLSPAARRIYTALERIFKIEMA